jgi:hypothetical protein
MYTKVLNLLFDNPTELKIICGWMDGSTPINDEIPLRTKELALLIEILDDGLITTEDTTQLWAIYENIYQRYDDYKNAYTTDYGQLIDLLENAEIYEENITEV